MKIINRLVIGLVILSSLIIMFVPNISYAAVAKNVVCDGIGLTAGDEGCTEGSGRSLSSITAFIINIFSWVVGVVAVLFAIIAGFKYITSGGDPSAIKSAKDTLLYVIIGLVIVALSQVIVNFVLDKTNNLDGKPSSFLKMRLLKPSHYDIK
jgi:uncharacterized membrane protein